MRIVRSNMFENNVVDLFKSLTNNKEVELLDLEEVNKDINLIALNNKIYHYSIGFDLNVISLTYQLERTKSTITYEFTV